ncbi:MAG: TetR family transcriptional regulator [Pseudomonadota bacterium]
MNAEILTRERILDAAEDVLRRFGPRKTTVVDVARALDVSHGTVYRHFPAKAALRDAVTERWLHRVSGPLAAIAETDQPPRQRLEQWLDALVSLKHKKALGDPELFATYHELAREARGAVDAHVAELVGQLQHILEDGAAAGVFQTKDPQAGARAVFQATARFHHPAHAAEWRDPAIEADYAAVKGLVLAGLLVPAP